MANILVVVVFSHDLRQFGWIMTIKTIDETQITCTVGLIFLRFLLSVYSLIFFFSFL